VSLVTGTNIREHKPKPFDKLNLNKKIPQHSSDLSYVCSCLDSTWYKKQGNISFN